MIRILFILFIVLLAAFLFLQGSLNERNGEKPAFLVHDYIAGAHHTNMEIKVHSEFKPDSFQLAVLKKEYSNIWAHLNHLYETNDVETGKEYYTEDWFKQMVHHYSGVTSTGISRIDEQHELHIQNWAWDALVCTAIDSNVVLHYQYPDKTIRTRKVSLAVVLLYQGDHWRIDALKVIEDKPSK
ncbi:MAG: hypothetical protein KGZ74_06710 [Chitinophagaceae bacterium]|nr:hypothetical protein [Chitinophagaceae bacterium]